MWTKDCFCTFYLGFYFLLWKRPFWTIGSHIQHMVILESLNFENNHILRHLSGQWKTSTSTRTDNIDEDEIASGLIFIFSMRFRAFPCAPWGGSLHPTDSFQWIGEIVLPLCGFLVFQWQLFTCAGCHKAKVFSRWKIWETGCDHH